MTSLPDLPLHKLLEYIAAGKLVGDALKEAKKKVKELWERREYGFTPDPKLAYELQRISKSDAYKRMKDCIGNHPFLSLIKLGLRIAELSDEGRVETIAKIKNSVYEKYGIRGVRILNMGGTGVLLEIIQYLSQLKMEKNYNQRDMAEKFEEIIDKWTEITIFHKAEHGQTMLRNTIIRYMEISRELFFVFASGIAGDQAKKVIANLSNKNEIRKRGYIFHLYERKEDMTGRVLYTWIFQKLA